jgi:hypothetical protein
MQRSGAGNKAQILEDLIHSSPFRLHITSTAQHPLSKLIHNIGYIDNVTAKSYRNRSQYPLRDKCQAAPMATISSSNPLLEILTEC